MLKHLHVLSKKLRIWGSTGTFLKSSDFEYTEFLTTFLSLPDKFLLLYKASYVHDQILQTWLMGAFNLSMRFLLEMYGSN